MKEFINKWSNWWIFNPRRKQLDDAFEKELNELIEREVALRQLPPYTQNESPFKLKKNIEKMTKELFIETIEAIEKQHESDVQFSKHLGKAFPNAFEANLTPNNEPLQNALIKVLQVATGDYLDDSYSWISHFIWELDFGRRNDKLKAYEKDGKEIPLSNAGELYDFLMKRVVNIL